MGLDLKWNMKKEQEFFGKKEVACRKYKSEVSENPREKRNAKKSSNQANILQICVIKQRDVLEIVDPICT